MPVEAVVAMLAFQAAQLALLAGIFMRLGDHGARLRQLERKAHVQSA